MCDLLGTEDRDKTGREGDYPVDKEGTKVSQFGNDLYNLMFAE